MRSVVVLSYSAESAISGVYFPHPYVLLRLYYMSKGGIEIVETPSGPRRVHFIILLSKVVTHTVKYKPTALTLKKRNVRVLLGFTASRWIVFCQLGYDHHRR